MRRAQVIAEARAWLGTPYVHQASAKGRGADCLGLVRGVWRAVYGAEPEIAPPYTPDWNERAFFKSERREPLLEAARRHMRECPPAERRPGDVLVFRVLPSGPAKHCGVLVADDRFVHAYAGRAVVESALSRWWTERLAGVFVFPEAEECSDRHPVRCGAPSGTALRLHPEEGRSPVSKDERGAAPQGEERRAADTGPHATRSPAGAGTKSIDEGPGSAPQHGVLQRVRDDGRLIPIVERAPWPSSY